MEKKRRNRVHEGITTKIVTGCGNLYLTVNFGEDGLPFEIFCHLGKSGGCSAGQVEAITRAISLGLRYGIPIEQYVKQLKGIQCNFQVMETDGKKVLSCPDAIAKLLERDILKKGIKGHETS